MQNPPVTTPFKPHEWEALGEETRRWVFTVAAREPKDSHNSSLPPSRDGADSKAKTNAKKKRRRKGKNRRPGGQPGHPGHQRPLVPPERVDKRVDHLPSECRRCGHELGDTDPDPEPLHHQIAEIPEIRPVVTDHVCYRKTCPECATTTTAKPSEDASSGCFGPNLRSLVVLLSGRYRISRRETADLCQSVFGLSVSVGSIANILDRASRALKAPYEEVAMAVKTAPVAYMDETGWREKGKGIHLWILVTSLCVLFRIGRRTKNVAQEMLGAKFGGSLVTDRYAAYLWAPDEYHQVCWAHLNRDFEALIERGRAAKKVGKSLQKISDDLFSIWHAYKDGRIQWVTMQRRMADVEMRTGAVLAQGARCRDPAARRLCKSLSKIEISLFVFARIEGVEPTNNTGERGIRPAVQWRKICFGTQSVGGSRFVERMLTVVGTCRVQDRPLLPYLRQVLMAADSGGDIPSLVAVGTTKQVGSAASSADGAALRQVG
jgi:transposase